MGRRVALRAQTTELPPIFAPRSAAPILIAAPKTIEDGPPSRLSNRVRLLVITASERVLAEAKPFEITAPTSDAASRSDSLTMLPSAEAVMLPRYVVKSTALRREEVQRPDLPPLRPYVVEREGRPGMVNGYTFPLWRSSGGSRELNLNLIDFGGRGVDHASYGRVISIPPLWSQKLPPWTKRLATAARRTGSEFVVVSPIQRASTKCSDTST